MPTTIPRKGRRFSEAVDIEAVMANAKANGAEDEDEETKQPKFSPRLTRAQSRAQRPAKYFK